jgi:hypothetical protein
MEATRHDTGKQQVKPKEKNSRSDTAQCWQNYQQRQDVNRRDADIRQYLDRKA